MPEGHRMTGRNPGTLADLIERYGDDIWLGGAPDGDRGDRHYRPGLTADLDRKDADRDRRPARPATTRARHNRADQLYGPPRNDPDRPH